ncbi:hypothetical protein L596_025717 [Steinernema carpocapsae]|nr:hypothetical protein L596_025717 [Steinernema carpocapsae]
MFRDQKEFYPQARFILKVDSDVVTNIAGIGQLCGARNEAPLVTGYCYDYRSRVARCHNSKFYLPRFIYAREKFPLYCSNATYILIRILANVPKQNNAGFSVDAGNFNYWCPEGDRPVPFIYQFEIFFI